MSTLLAGAVPPPAPGGGGTDIGNPILGNGLQGILENEGGIGFFGRLIPTVISFIFVVGSIGFVIYLIWGAVDYITAGGDKQSLQNAQAKIKNAIIGMIMMISMYAVVRLIEQVFGLDILNIDIGALIIS